MNTIKKRAACLVMGDVIVGFDDAPPLVKPFVVLSTEPARGGQIAVEAWSTANSTIEASIWPGARSVTVDAFDPDFRNPPRATDAEIDQLVEATRDYLEVIPAPISSVGLAPGSLALKLPNARREKLAKLVDRLAPVQAPTLAETLDALRVLANEGAVGVHLNAATRLLDRARRAGVMP